MRITWRGLEIPTRIERDTDVSSPYYGRFYVEPFERGFGTTIGNGLRRVLLSALEGSAIRRSRSQVSTTSSRQLKVLWKMSQRSFLILSR